MSEKKEYRDMALEVADYAYEEGKEDGREEALSSLGSLSIDELIALSKSNGKAGQSKKVVSRGRSGGGKRVRRSAEDIAALASKIQTVVKHGGKDGVSAETIREKLGIERKELPRAIAEALGQRLISKRGHKRATLYFAGSKVGKPKGGARKTKKTHAKKASKASKSKASKRSAKSKAAHTNGVTAAASAASTPASAE